MGKTKKGEAEIKKSGEYNLTPGGFPSYFKDRVIMDRLIMIVLMLIVGNTWGEDPIILLHADRAVYKKEEIVLEGEVELQFKDIHLRADLIRLNSETRMLQAKGEVILEDKEKRIYGQELNYNMEEEKGVMLFAHTKIEDTYYSGESIEMLGEGRFILNNCTFHTCDLENPHYRLRAKRVEVKTNDRLQARSLFFEVGGVPLFYLPIYYRNLKREKGSRLVIKTGYNAVSGFYAKGRYRYFLKDRYHGEILCDYFQKRGWGKGIRYRYLIGGSGKGRIDFYHIEEEDTSRSRWIATSDYYQEITRDTTGGIKIDLLSDELVERRYGEEWTTRNKLESYLHLTQSKERYVLRGLLYRKDELEGGRFMKKEEDLPRVTFQSKRLNIGKGPFYYKFGLDLGREWEYRDRYHNNFLKGDLDILGKIAPSKRVTFSPNIGITGKWEGTPITGSYYTDFPIRIEPYLFLDIDLKHSFKYELQEEGKITKNRLSGEVMVIPLREFKTGVSSEYDLIEEEFKHIIGDIWIIPNRYINLQLQSFYDIKESRFRKIGIFLKGHHKDLYDIDLRYSKYLTTRSEILRWKIRIDLIRRLKLGLRFDGGYDLKIGKSKWCEYGLYRDLHCLEASATFRESESLTGGEPEREFVVNIGIKAFPEAKLGEFD
ncbi:MAG: hypothetical protein QME40_06555 [bacterium]|nr:hypothetical protein [bacterium]